MELVAIAFLACLAVGYFVLAGCDIGIGMLMPFLARPAGGVPATGSGSGRATGGAGGRASTGGETDRRWILATMAPFFLGSEVWLVAMVGTVAGVFPELEASLLEWAWPVLVALLAGWLCRDAGLWFWARTDRRWRPAWEQAVVAGSWILAGAWGLFLGGLLTGGEPLGPVPIMCAVTVVTLFALRGAAFGAERLAAVPGDSSTADVAARATRWLSRGALAAVLGTAALTLLPGAVALDRPVLAAVVLATLVAALAVTTGLSGPRWARHTSAYAMAAPVLLVAAGLALPGLVPDAATTTLVALAVAPALPVMVLGQVWLYSALRRPAVGGYFA